VIYSTKIRTDRIIIKQKCILPNYEYECKINQIQDNKSIDCLKSLPLSKEPMFYIFLNKENMTKELTERVFSECIYIYPYIPDNLKTSEMSIISAETNPKLCQYIPEHLKNLIY
jgi:hypothetical protein